MNRLIFDLDGVLITYEKNFAEIYSAEFGIDVAEIYEFFSKDYRECAVGRADLKDRIQKYIPRWKWGGGVEELLRYWFDSQSDVDMRLIALIKSARSTRNECYIASDQDALRSKYVKNLFPFETVFDGSFLSYRLGSMKTEVHFFEHILETLQSRPSDIYFWDDNPINVAVAQQVGINAEIYTRFEDFHASFSERFGIT